MNAFRAVRSYGRALLGLRAWLAHGLTVEAARAAVVRRLEDREAAFLQFARRCVFDNPRSPYLPLFRRADCAYEDLASGVRRDGLERELTRLREAGVFISLEEFKGRQPIVRGDLTVPQSAADFDNPFVGPSITATTGGSSGRAVRSTIDLDHLAVRATYQALIVDALGLLGAPFALWYPQLPASSGLVAALMYAKFGMPPRRWFDIDAGPRDVGGWVARAMTGALMRATRVGAAPMAKPEPSTPAQIVQWLVRSRDRTGQVLLQSYASRAVRLSETARARGHDMAGVTFHVGAEPLTDARCREIEASGAAVYPRYSSTELGTIAVGCTDRREPGDHHLCRDLIAATGGPQAPETGATVLQMTSLHTATPKVMINVELGDCAVLEPRRCSCPFGELGLDLHLLRVRSIARVTCEGMTVAGSELVRITEEALIPRYGGSALDYQWVERHTSSGMGQLLLRVHPRLGFPNEGAVTQAVLDRLRSSSASGAMVARVWSEAGTISVVREEPKLTGRGKALPLLHERTD